MKNRRSILYVVLVVLFLVIATLLTISLLLDFNNNSGIQLSLGKGNVKFIILGLLIILGILIVLFVILRFIPPKVLNGKAKDVGIDFDEYNKDVIAKVIDNREINRMEKKYDLSIPEKKKEDNKLKYEIQAYNHEELDEFDNNIFTSSESRFFMLTEIDKRYENYVSPEYDNEITLKEICESFRNFSARKLKLYYDIKDIRRFIAGLAVTKLLILQGMSGTGKTSLAYAFGEYLDNKTIVVPIQPMWKERTDLIGYYNEFTKKFNETTLLYKMYEANCNRNIYITVLDEMNIARVEYYFAEFLSLLELPNPEGRNLDVVSDVWETDPKLLHDGKLRLPTNMWFIGTANNDDSTFAISDKVYDRAMVLNLDKKADVFDGEETKYRRLSIDHLEELFNNAQLEYEISDRNLRRIKLLDKYLIDTFHITFGNRIMKQIKTYVPVVVASGGEELDALDDILSRKVLRKLESKNPVYVRSQADSLCSFIEDLFGQDKMPLCIEVIHQIEQNV